MEVAIVLTAVWAALGAAAALWGADSRDGRDWRPIRPVR
jgi:hypothetical protein